MQHVTVFAYVHVHTQLLKQNLSLKTFTVTLDFTQHELSPLGECSHAAALSIYASLRSGRATDTHKGFISSVQLWNIPLTQLISNLAHNCET